MTQPDFKIETPDGDDRLRRICTTCGFIDYVNPKIVAGSVVEDGTGRILMCRRAIEPRRGFWTLPAGYMEEGEAVDAAAAREAREEACAAIDPVALLAVYSIPRISQVQIFFRARLTGPEVSAGPESLEVALYEWDALPWTELAFPSVAWALRDWRAGAGLDGAPPAMRTQSEGDGGA